MSDYIDKTAARQAALAPCNKCWKESDNCPVCDGCKLYGVAQEIARIPAADVRPVAEIEKIIESLQEQVDIYNARAKELLVEEDGQVSQYTWAVSLRETYRRIIKTLDDFIS